MLATRALLSWDHNTQHSIVAVGLRMKIFVNMKDRIHTTMRGSALGRAET